SRSFGAPVLRLECLNPSILKTERPPVTCARSNSYCGRRNRPTAPPGPSRRAGSFIGAKRTCTSASSIPGLVARNLLTFGIFGSCAPGYRTATRPRERRHVHFPKRWTHEPHSHHWCRQLGPDPKE